MMLECKGLVNAIQNLPVVRGQIDKSHGMHLIIMQNNLNNVDLDKISNTIDTGKRDRQTLRKPVKLQGEWNLDPLKEY